jgi:hypothetical protein
LEPESQVTRALSNPKSFWIRWFCSRGLSAKSFVFATEVPSRLAKWLWSLNPSPVMPISLSAKPLASVSRDFVTTYRATGIFRQVV